MSDPTVWDNAVSVFTLGADRRVFPRPAQPKASLESVLAALPEQSPAEWLLDVLAVAGQHQRAGRRPRTGVRPEAPICPPDPQPVCPPVVARHLTPILAGDQGDVLAEWLSVCQAAGWRCPEEWLPGILPRLGQYDPLGEVLGERGRWLAGLLPNQSDRVLPSLAQADTLWLSGPDRLRVALLVRLRQQAPEQARALLSSTWGEETAEFREAGLRTLSIGLGPADEAPLVSALSDRAISVRLAAGELLGGLPTSAFVNRMQARAAKLIGLKASPLTLQVPDSFSEEDAADGLSLKMKPDQRVSFIASGVPIRYWATLGKRDPAEWIQRARALPVGQLSDALQAGWRRAAVRDQDGVWLQALAPTGYETLVTEGWLELIERLDPAVTDRLVPDLVARLGLDGATVLLRRLGPVWSVVVSQAALKRLRTTLKQAQTPDRDLYVYIQFLALAGGRLHPEVHAEALKWIGATIAPRRLDFGQKPVEGPLKPQFEQVQARLVFRQAMHEDARRGSRPQPSSS